MNKQQAIADMQRAIKCSKERIAALEAGDYSGFRYVSGEETARYVHNRFQATIDAAQRVLDSLITPEDFA